MPFAKRLSGDAGQDYFVDGMVEEITTAAFPRVRSIFVVASGSGLSFKGQAVSAQEAARKLGVAYLKLEGGVRRAGGKVRIAVRLIDGADGSQLWAERFDDSLEDVFALQERVALSVACRIEPTVQEADMRKTAGRPTENMGSYDLYLRAWPLHRAYTQAATLRALDLLGHTQAIALDPNYGARRWHCACASSPYNIGVFHGWFDDYEAYRLKGVALAHHGPGEWRATMPTSWPTPRRWWPAWNGTTPRRSPLVDQGDRAGSGLPDPRVDDEWGRPGADREQRYRRPPPGDGDAARPLGTGAPERRGLPGGGAVPAGTFRGGRHLVEGDASTRGTPMRRAMPSWR